MAMITRQRKYVRVHFLKIWSSIKRYFDIFANWTESHSGKKVGRIHSDNVPEFSQKKKALWRMGTKDAMSSPYNPKSIGLAQRMDRVFFEKARAMLGICGLKKKYWYEEVRHAAYFHNQTIASEFGSNTLVEKLLERIPNNSTLKIFACAAFVYLHTEIQRDKLESEADRGCYLGKEHGQNFMYLIDSRRVATTKYVSLEEGLFPFQNH